jgi:hypothetical protein
MDEKPKLDLIWFDENITNLENTYSCFLLKQKYNLHSFNNMEKVISFLQEHSNTNYDLITSGHKGENLCEIIEAYSNVNHIIVFCANVNYHKTWASKFPKIINVTCNINEGVETLNYLESLKINSEEYISTQDLDPNMNMESEE